ncbi:MAG TPA: flavin reductase family protein [Nocardioides sp.]
MTGIDTATYRQVLGRFCTGVAVVTSLDADGAPVGLTVGSFSSVSLDPPLVAFFVARTSTTFPAIAASGRFCANILGAGQDELGMRFARSGGDKFAGVDWWSATTGAPVLSGSHGFVDCEIDTIDTFGDHHLVVGRVAELGAEETTDRPLVFYTSAFHQLREVC